jgi:hypothetical protein
VDEERVHHHRPRTEPSGLEVLATCGKSDADLLNDGTEREYGL